MMEINDIEKILEKTGIPFAYHHFEVEEAVNPPFICWLLPGSGNFAADGKVYFKANRVTIELYTNEREFELEQKIENLLEEQEIFWQKEEFYIKTENMFETLYEMEV